MMARRLLVLVVTLLMGSIVVARTPAAAAVEPTSSLVVVRGSDWYVRDTLTSGTADHTFTYGLPGDVQLLGDWDGDGDATPGVVRGSTWYLRNTLEGGQADLTFACGYLGDYPVVGDWDGNGTDHPGVPAPLSGWTCSASPWRRGTSAVTAPPTWASARPWRTSAQHRMPAR